MEPTQLRTRVQRVLAKMDQQAVDPAAERERMIQAVAEIQAASGTPVDLDEIGRAVDAVLAEQANEERAAEEVKEQARDRNRKRIPAHVWILGGILMIPLLFPLGRVIGQVIGRLLRVAL